MFSELLDKSQQVVVLPNLDMEVQQRSDLVSFVQYMMLVLPIALYLVARSSLLVDDLCAGFAGMRSKSQFRFTRPLNGSVNYSQPLFQNECPLIQLRTRVEWNHRTLFFPRSKLPIATESLVPSSCEYSPQMHLPRRNAEQGNKSINLNLNPGFCVSDNFLRSVTKMEQEVQSR